MGALYCVPYSFESLNFGQVRASSGSFLNPLLFLLLLLLLVKTLQFYLIQGGPPKMDSQCGPNLTKFTDIMR